MIVLQLPSASSVDNRDYSRDRPRTLQNDSVLRRSILFLPMVIEEIKIATRSRCMEERTGRVDNLAKNGLWSSTGIDSFFATVDMVIRPESRGSHFLLLLSSP